MNGNPNMLVIPIDGFLPMGLIQKINKVNKTHINMYASTLGRVSRVTKINPMVQNANYGI